MANSDIPSTGSGWTYFSKTRFTSVISLNVFFFFFCFCFFQTQKQLLHFYTFESFYTAWTACEASALPIDLSRKRVEPAPVHRFDYHGG